MTLRSVSLLSALIAFCGPGLAQVCQNAPTIADYIRCEIRVREHPAVEDFVSKQTAAPAAALNGNALADSAAAPDLFGASLNPARFSTRSLSPNANDFAGIVNLYALYIFWHVKNPFDYETYLNSSMWRRFAFSADHSTAVDSRSSDLPGNTNTYMAKAVIYGFRDIAATASRFDQLVPQLAGVSHDVGEIAFKIAAYLHPIYGSGETFLYFQSRLNGPGFRHVAAHFTREELRAIGEIINQYSARNIAFDQALDRAAHVIQQRPQIAVDFTSRLNYSHGANLYRTEIIADNWLSGGKWNSTSNLSYDFSNARTAATKNREVFRIVEAISVPVKTFGYWKEEPIVPSLSGEADYGTNGTPIYRAQGKLTLPLRLGWAVPLFVQYTNRTAVGPRADIKASIGLTFDLAKGIIDASTPEALRVKNAPGH